MEVWEKVLAHGKAAGAMAAGLGARDTLRLEAAMPLYGHELYGADQSDSGRLVVRRESGRTRVSSAERRWSPRSRTRSSRCASAWNWPAAARAREHYAGLGRADKPIGEITSGTFSPTLQKPIAMAYVPPQYAEIGTELAVDIRGTAEPARVVKLPFYYSCRLTHDSLTHCSDCHEPQRPALRRNARMGPRCARKAAARWPRSGITAFAIEQLTDLVHMVLPKVGAQVKAGAAVRRSRIGQGRQRSLQPGRWRSDRRA